MTQHSSFSVKTVLAFGAIYIIWGSTYLAIRYAVETIPPFLMMGTRSVIAGFVLGFAGIVYLIASTQGIDASGADTIASFAIVLGAFSWSGGAIYSRVAKLPKSSIVAAGMELIIGGVLLLIAGLILGEASALQAGAVSLRSLLGLGYLIVFGSVITFSAYLWLLGRTSATRISTHTYVNPIIAVFLGWIIAAEPLTTELLIATILIVVSVYLVLNDQLNKKKEGSA